jgi:mono/diheme cytochrome c family protein
MDRHRLRAGSLVVSALVVTAVHSSSHMPLIAAPDRAVHAPARLSETGLYLAGQIGVVDPRNRQFSPQYPLWSDGAAKTRWIFLPPGTTIDARDDNAWNFPVGTRFWKEFRFEGRKVETRMLWKATAAQWVAVSYVWNDALTDAVLASDQGEPDVVALTPSKQHSVPSSNDCLACHGSTRTEPLGFNPLQLSTDRDPNAVHGEPLPPDAITLRTLVDGRLLTPARTDLVSTPPRIDASNARTRTMLGYLSTNCGSCHRGDGQIAAEVPSLRYSDVVRDGDGVAASLVGRHTAAWRVPGVADGASVLLDPAAPDSSAMLVRMRSRSPSSQMPPLGTVLRDQAAVDALRQWVSGDLAVGSALSKK